jgi:hypothetical protein
MQTSRRENQIICSETDPEYEYGVALLAIGPIRSRATSIGGGPYLINTYIWSFVSCYLDALVMAT